MICEAFRGGVFHFLSDPKDGAAGSYEFFEDGLLVVENGRISELGDAKQLVGKRSLRRPDLQGGGVKQLVLRSAGRFVGHRSHHVTSCHIT